MTRRLAPLFRLAVRHAYYGDGPAPLAWRPFPETAARLRGAGAVVRARGAELVVGVPVVPSDPDDPGSALVLARRPLGDAFRFALVPTDAGVAAVTEAAGWRPGRTVFALDNLRDDDDEDAVLGVGPDRLGDAVVLVTGPVLRVPLGPPLAQPRVVLRDRAGAELDQHEATDPAPVDAVAVPLDRLPGPGRYTAEVDGGPTVEFAFAPPLRGWAPLAVAELFAEPPDGLVLPDASRFLDGEAPTGRRFWAELPARTTRWRYVVVKTSGDAGAPLSDYAVEPVDDGPEIGSDAPGEFTTEAPVAWRRAPALARLARAPGTPVLALPNPGPGTPLVEGDDGPLAVHHVYV